MTDSPEPPFPFTPVPGRARHDGWTPDRQRRFVDALAVTGVVTAAARAVGMSTRAAYNLRRRAGEDSALARAWDAALDRGCADALDVGVHHALHGERVPIFYRGRQVGEYRRFNDRLVLAALRAGAARAEARRPAAGPFPTGELVEQLHSALSKLASSEFPADSRDGRELPPGPPFRNDTRAKP